MKRAPATIVILPVIARRHAWGVYRRPDELPPNVTRFPGIWHRRGRSDDPFRVIEAERRQSQDGRPPYEVA